MTAESLSVVMPVRDAMPYLRDSVASILDQTHPHFEFLILDDASTDGSAEYIRELPARDPRIRVVRSNRDLGVVGAGNRVVELASSPLVARMDADDVCEPDRLERQLEVFDDAPDAVLVANLADGIDSSGRRVRGRDRWRLVRRSIFPPFPHASMMYRRADFLATRYREESGSWHDLDFVFRIAKRGRVLVLPEALHHFRYNTGSVTLERAERDAIREAELMWRCFAELASGSDGYDHVLLSVDGNGRPASADAEAWVGRYRDAMLLWAGQPPAANRAGGPLPWRLRRAWHRHHPGSLRALLRLAIAARDRAAGLVIRDGRVREWRYG